MNVKNSIISFLTISLTIAVVFAGVSSCKKDKFSNDTSHKLSFSLDTLSFDTVFSEIGSSTRIFKIYNPNNSKVKISSISLAGGASSFFRVNVNGLSSTNFKDVELRANDSIWVFIEVTIDPNNNSNPILVMDSLVCVTNGNIQDVKLEAFGQDVYFHKPSDGDSSFELSCGEEWKSDKPHLVFGKALVDTNCQLNIAAGTKVFFHNDGAIEVLKGASLKVNGTKDSPVYFEGDRRESWYGDMAGQWIGIILSKESVDHEINYLHLKNAQKGLECSAGVSLNSEALKLNNCSFLNCTAEGLHFINTKVKAYNLVVANCVGNELLIEKGGSYSIIQGTIGNYVAQEAGATNAGNGVKITNWKMEDETAVNADLSQCDFYNCIIYGSQSNEVVFDDNGAVFIYNFYNSLMRIQGGANSTSQYSNCVFNEAPQFEDESSGIFLLKAISPAVNLGDLNVIQVNGIELEYDFKGENRTISGNPDAGAYEL